MAAPVLAAILHRSFKTFLSLKPFIPATPQCGALVQTANYNPRPLRRNLTDPYIPDRTSDKTPEWQRTDKFDRKLYGRYGDASGVEPAALWPTDERLEEMIKDEEEWHPPLEVMLKNIRLREEEEAAKRRAKEKLIAANMAKMPKMVADWRRERRDSKRMAVEEKMRRDKLLAEVRERLGYALDPRSFKFQEVVAEVEKEQQKKKKLLKRRQREEQAATPLAPAGE